MIGRKGRGCDENDAYGKNLGDGWQSAVFLTWAYIWGCVCVCLCTHARARTRIGDLCFTFTIKFYFKNCHHQ